jgi:CBS domain-containing protein
MGVFDSPIREHMSLPNRTVHPEERLSIVETRLQAGHVSGLPVVDSAGRPLGVITHTDLIGVGTVPAVTGTGARRLMLPDLTAKQVMHAPAVCVPLRGQLADAVDAMLDHRIHRVLVIDGDKLVGIVTAWDAMKLVAAARVQTPIENLMSSSAVTVSPEERVQSAIERMQNASVHGLVVVERVWPVGVFGQEEALAAEKWPDPSTVEQWFSRALLCLPPGTPAHRAAEQAVAMHARHIVVVTERGIAGVVTPTDLLRAA